MVFAMHHIQLLTIVRHLDRDSWFESYLSRQVAEGRLIASVTSEVGTGGDMARSIAAVTPAENGLVALREAGAHRQLRRLRRRPAHHPAPRARSPSRGDQVAALTHQDQHSLEPTGTWDVLGMRGTCSPGSSSAPSSRPSRCWPRPFAKVAAESMVPISHILWSHLWLGIAEDAFDRARAFVKAAAKRTPGRHPAGRAASVAPLERGRAPARRW